MKRKTIPIAEITPHIYSWMSTIFSRRFSFQGSSLFHLPLNRGTIALVLLIGLMAVTSFAAVTVSTNRLTVTTGQKSADAVTVKLSGLEADSVITIKPPLYSTYSATATTDDDWSSMVGDPDLTNDTDGVTTATEGLVTADALILNNSHPQNL